MEDSFCRICLQKHKLYSTFVSISKSICETINKVTNQQIFWSENDGLPQTICCHCNDKLSMFMEFVDMIISSDNQLKDSFSSNDNLLIKSELAEELNENDILYEISADNVSIENGHDDGDENNELEEDEIKVTKGRVNKKKKKLFCCKCEANFNEEEQRLDHFQQTHESLQDFNIKYSKAHKYECKYCFKKFLRKSSLNKHYEDKAFVEPKQEYKSLQKQNNIKLHDPKVCPTCGRIFSDKYQLALHESRIHSTERPFACLYASCKQKFALQKLLKRHIKNVHEEKRMICDFCSKLFRTMKDLRQHMYVHMDKKPLQCARCPKTFTLLRVLKAHELASHSGIDKPFQCDLCEKGYKWKEDLRSHKLVAHLKIFPFKCRHHCGKGYSGSSNRNWHEKRCPNNPSLIQQSNSNVNVSETVQYNQF